MTQHDGQSRSWSAKQGKSMNRKSLAVQWTKKQRDTATRQQPRRSLQYTIDQLVLLLFKQNLNESRPPKLLFLTFSALVAKPEKLLYTVATASRGLMDREIRTKWKVWQRTPPCSFEDDENNHTPTGAMQVSVGLASIQGSLRLTD